MKYHSPYDVAQVSANAEHQRSPRFIDDNIMKIENHNDIHNHNYELHHPHKQHNCFPKDNVGIINEKARVTSFSFEHTYHSFHSKKVHMYENDKCVDQRIYDKFKCPQNLTGTLMKPKSKLNINDVYDRANSSCIDVNISKYFSETYSSPDKMYSGMSSKENSLFHVSPRSFLMGDRNQKPRLIYCNSLQRS